MNKQQQNSRKATVEVARNMLGSRVAKALLEDKRFPDRALELRLRRLEAESKQQSSVQDNHRRLFRNNVFTYKFTPTIVVERPSSPTHFKDSVKMYETSKEVPHYMTGLTKHRPSMYIPMTKLDAFKVIRKRQTNLWESNLANKSTEEFRSILGKSPRLKAEEEEDLNVGWTAYRPVSRMEKFRQQRLQDKKKEKKQLASTVKIQSNSATYITQLDIEADQSRREKKTPLSVWRQQLEQSDFNNDKLERFQKIRDRQKHEYFKYIKDSDVMSI